MKEIVFNVCINNYVITKEGISPILSLCGKSIEIMGLNKNGFIEWKQIKFESTIELFKSYLIFSEYCFGYFSGQTKLFTNQNYLSIQEIVEGLDNNNKYLLEKVTLPNNLIPTKFSKKGFLVAIDCCQINKTANEVIFKLPRNVKFKDVLKKSVDIKFQNIFVNALYSIYRISLKEFNTTKDYFKNDMFKFEYTSGFYLFLKSIINENEFRFSFNNKLLIYCILINNIFNDLNIKYDSNSTPVTFSLNFEKRNENPYYLIKGYLIREVKFIDLKYTDNNWHPVINFVPAFV